MGKEKLTDKQTQILEYIRHEILAKGYPPSIREICQAVDLKSTSSVHAQLSSLEAKGYIRRDLTKSRSIEIIDDDFSLIQTGTGKHPYRWNGFLWSAYPC